MDTLRTWLIGKKTYIIAYAAVVLGTLQGLDIYILPEWAWAVIAAAGLATLRASVTGVAENIPKKK